MREKIISSLQQQLECGEALLVTSHANRFYLTGFPSSAGQVVVTKNHGWFLVDFRYIEKARATIQGLTVCLSGGLDELRGVLTDENVTRLYVETESTTLHQYSVLKTALPGIDVQQDNRFDAHLLRLRQCKSDWELQAIRRAQAITDDTFTYILDRLRPGRTEREIMLDMELYARQHGSDGVAFSYIVVSGKNSALPHGEPTDKPLENGDFLTMDFGAVVDGYRSDMTRTVAIGGVSEQQQRVYDTVHRAQQAALAAIRPGVSCREVDAVARQLIDDAGFAGCFGHGLGHSVGIDIHEMPAFNTRCDTLLEPGMVMTVEPGIYLEGQFGVRIEDMVVVTDDGYENLTLSPKKLIIV